VEFGHSGEVGGEDFTVTGLQSGHQKIDPLFGALVDFFSFENCLGRRRHVSGEPKSSKALHKIVLEMFLIGLLQIVSTEIVGSQG
jgi:hypothetical protein